MALVFIRSSWTLWDFTHPLPEAQHTIISISQPRTCNVKEKKVSPDNAGRYDANPPTTHSFFFSFFFEENISMSVDHKSSEDGKCSREILHIKTATEVR